ncbi:glycosyltransferase family 4 protein [Conexibacter sp. SYSU D00693]|uniref:glycosyltransferase family 4 protein n=1 Tax=Conexibacter sp. SYSU D00693 TaxID=2812560 RepID=UPI00196B2E6A|nr:glycosyltransferase family 4 protein [Conexibacter sp. SYSU D00693]
MRQLFVVHGPVYGGGQGQFLRLQDPMARRGWELCGVVPTGAPAAERLRSEGMPVLETPLHRLRRTTDPRTHAALALTMAPEVRALRRIIREHDADVVQVHGDTNPHGAIAAALEGRAVVWQLYDTVTPPPARRLTMPFVTRVADVITTWGEALGRSHPGTDTLGERWIPVFPPVDGRRFAPDPQRRAAARRALGVGEDDVVVGTVGNRNPTKGHQHLVEAVRLASAREPRIVGRILGQPSPVHEAYEAQLQAAAGALGDRVRIEDPGRRVPDLVPGFDVFCLSSVPRSEGMPTVILEAMAAGVPVLSTDVGAVRELVADGETGIVVEPERPELLAEHLVALAGDEARRRQLGEAGRRRYAEHFDLEVLADRHVAAYELAVRHRRGRRRLSRAARRR